MEKNKNLQKILTIATILTLTISILIASLPITAAQNPIRNKQTFAFCSATPNPIGVNQQALIWMGISDYLYVSTDGWNGLTVTVTKPDGATETLGPFRTDSTGSTGTMYTPTLVGTYTFQTHFPAQWFNWSTADVYYESSSSEVFELTVTEEQREYWPYIPLPTEYWSRPIDAELREWNVIAGNWLYGASLNNFPYWNFEAPYNEYAPDSGHILWAKPLTQGGLAGGELGPHAYDFGDAYEGYFLNSVIINGKLYYNRYQSNGGTRVEQQVVAVDLHTGEEMWCRPLVDSEGNVRTLSFGQVFYWDSYNVHGAYAYLWSQSGRTWNAFDPFTGRWVYGINNVPSGSTHVYGPNGEILVYTVNMNNGWMTLWNSTQAVKNGGDGSWIRGDMGRIFEGTNGIQWNKTITAGLPGRVMSVMEDKILGGTDDQWSSHLAILRGDYSQTFWCLDISPGHEGTLLFNKTWIPTPTQAGSAFIGASAKEGIFVVAIKATRQLVAFSLETGNQIWGPTDSQLPVDYFTIANWRRGVFAISNGKVISGGMGGRVHVYDAETGILEWYYDAVDEYTEILWGDNWPLYLSFIADGKIYLHHAEHSPVDPMPRGAPLICLDLETGEEVWKMNIRGVHWGGYPIIGDSTIAMFDAYDTRIYAIGKGPSATTITAPDSGVTVGSSVTIKGNVIDISPGTKEYAVTARFPNGVPAISDEHMSKWMNYVYMQFNRPADAVGVAVKIEIVDPNGQYAWIGTATSDADGNYAYHFVPQVKGLYTIIANFDGSASYYGSHAVTYLAVDPAPAPYPTIPGYQGPSASEVANSVIAKLPADATPQEVAQAVINAMPEYPQPQEIPEYPEYTTMDMILAILVAIAIVIGLVLLLRKK